MIRLIIRKLILMVIILGLLNIVAFNYGLRHPALFSPSNFFVPRGISDPEYIRERHGTYLQGLLRGNLGRVSGTEIATVIRDPIKNSLILLGTAIVTTVVFGLLFGMTAISGKTRRIRPWAVVFLAAGSSLPGFVFAAVLIAFLVYQLFYTEARTPLLPISGFGIDRHLIMPVLVLAVQPTFHLAKVTAGLLENELHRDYITVAYSKGLTWSQLVWRHAWRNMLSPVLVTLGDSMRLMIGGLVIVEAIFLWPGIGRIFLYTLGLRLDARAPGQFFGNPELTAILAVILGGLLLLTDLVVSILAYQLDPRLSQPAEGSQVSLA
ncbi:MAG: ABC transporter permease [Chloroflexota bacterium]